MEASTAKKKFRPGDLAPITGIYLVTHERRHRAAHEVVIIRGEHLPACRTCAIRITYEIVRPISHITHDWDFSGPHNLAVRPEPEDFQDVRLFRRVHVQAPVTLKLSGMAKTVAVHGYTSDLSAGGMGAVIREKLPAQCNKVTVHISVEPGEAPLVFRARLRYQQGFRYGFEFTGLGAAEREAMRHLIGNRRHKDPGMTM